MSPDESWKDMNTARKKTFTGVATAIVVAGLTATSVAGPALATTQPVTATCDAITIDLTGYPTIPGQPATIERVLVTPATPLVPAVYGEPELLKPATDAVPAVYDYEYLFFKFHPQTGELMDERWFKNSGPADPSVWKLMDTVTTEVTPAIPAQPAEYGPAPLLTAEIPAQDAVYADQIVPAVPGDDAPNSLTLYIDGVLELETDFGTTYDAVVVVDGTADHPYLVEISEYETEGIVTISGETEACALVPPPVDVPPVDVPPVKPTVVTDVPAAAVPVVAASVAAVPVAAAPVKAAPVAQTEVLASTGVASWTTFASIMAAAMMLAGAALTIRRRRA